MANHQIRNREPVSASEKAKPHAKTSGALNLHPDYALVFSTATKTAISEACQAISTLADAGFYVALERGASQTMLLLVKLPSEVTANAEERVKLVFDRIPWSKLTGVESSFPLSTKEPSWLRNASIEQIAKQFDIKTAAWVQLQRSLLTNLMYSALVGLLKWWQRDRVGIENVAVMLFCGANAAARWLVVVDKAFLSEEVLERSGKSINDRSIKPLRKNYRQTDTKTRELRRLMFVGVAFGLLVLFTLGQLCVLAFEIFMTQMYDGPFQGIAKLMPAGAGIAAAIVFGIVNSKVVEFYCNWEDYMTESELRATKVQRAFYLDVLLAFLPIVLTSFFYIPFGNKLIGVLPYLKTTKLAAIVPLAPDFKLDTMRLTNQASFFLLQQPLINLVMKFVLPTAGTKLVGMLTTNPITASNDNKFAREQVKSTFSADTEIKSLIISFGHILVLTPVWPVGAAVVLGFAFLRYQLVMLTLSRSWRLPSPDFSAGLTYQTLRQWAANLKFVLLLSSILAPTISVMYGSAGHLASSATVHKLYDVNRSVLSVSWSKVFAYGLIGENLVLAVYTIASRFYGGYISNATELGVGVASKVGIKTLNVDEDAAWRGINISQELQRVVGAKVE